MRLSVGLVTSTQASPGRAMVRCQTPANSHQNTAHLFQVLLQSTTACLMTVTSLLVRCQHQPRHLTSQVCLFVRYPQHAKALSALATVVSQMPSPYSLAYVHAASAMSHCLSKHHTQHGLQCTMRSPFLLTNEQAQCACSPSSKIAPPDEASKEEGDNMSSSRRVHL